MLPRSARSHSSSIYVILDVSMALQLTQVVAVACAGLKGVVEIIGPVAISNDMADVMSVTNNLLLEKVRRPISFQCLLLSHDPLRVTATHRMGRDITDLFASIWSVLSDLASKRETVFESGTGSFPANTWKLGVSITINDDWIYGFQS